MNLQEIKRALKFGYTVHWKNVGYKVIGDPSKPLSLMIKCTMNNHCIGLTWMDGETLNGKEEDFFVA